MWLSFCHLIDEIICLRLRVGQDVAVAVENFAAKSCFLKPLTPFFSGSGGENFLKPLNNRTADFHLVKAGAGGINQRSSLHLNGAPKGLESSRCLGRVKPYWEPDTRILASQSAIMRPQDAEATINDNSTTLIPCSGLYCSIKYLLYHAFYFKLFIL